MGTSQRVWLNGWRRLWIVATILGLIGGAIFSFIGKEKYGEGFEYRRALEQDINTPQCSEFVVRDIAQLREPPVMDDGGGCWHLYISRYIAAKDGRDETPYSIEVFEKNETARKMEAFGVGTLIWGTATIILSALVYAAGSMLAWIIRGFGKAQ